MTVTADDGVRLSIASTGEGGDGAVLCHGGPGLWDYLKPVAGMVDDVVRVYRYDQRGCGRSGGRAGPFTIDRFVADLDSVRQETGHERWIVGGHSWGATLALLYAVGHARHVSGVLYVSGTGLEWEAWKAQYATERDRRLARLSDRYRSLSRLRRRSARQERELILLRWSVDYADVRRGRRRATQMLASGHRPNSRCNRLLNAELKTLDPVRLSNRCRALEVPFLIIDGGKDPRPRAAVDSLVDVLPNVERVIIPGAGHFPWVEKPSIVKRVMRRWVSTILRSSVA